MVLHYSSHQLHSYLGVLVLAAENLFQPQNERMTDARRKLIDFTRTGPTARLMARLKHSAPILVCHAHRHRPRT